MLPSGFLFGQSHLFLIYTVVSPREDTAEDPSRFAVGGDTRRLNHGQQSPKRSRISGLAGIKRNLQFAAAKAGLTPYGAFMA